MKDLLTSLALWDDSATPKIILANFKSLCANPVDYLRSRMTALIGISLPHLAEIFPTSGSDPILKVTPIPSASPTYWKVEVIAASAPSWVSDLSLNIGSKTSGGSNGVWLGYSTSISTGIPSGTPANVVISVEAGALKDQTITDEWGMMASLSAHTDAVLDDSMFTIQPAIAFAFYRWKSQFADEYYNRYILR